MQLASVVIDGAVRTVLREGGRAWWVADDDLGTVLRDREGDLGGIRPMREVDAEARPAPLVVAPEKIVCVGLNYVSHILEMGRELPEHPTLFAKYSCSLIGAIDDICLPRVSREMDWEAELALIVGRRLRHADEDEALAAVAGYCVFNDVTARDFQWRTTQWLQGKTFEATSPLGPTLVTPDEVDHAQALDLRCTRNGETVQEANTEDLLFTPARTLSYVSQVMTLVPGDVVALGTPSGVGAGRTPPAYLQDGDVLETHIQGLGMLRNTCRQESA